MAKKKHEESTVPELSPFLKGMMDAAHKKFGEKEGRTYMGSEIQELIVGIPLPSLALMYLFDSTVFPLGKTLVFAGKPGSHKSSMGAEIGRWFCEANGYAQINECEGAKISPSLIKSIAREEAFKRFQMNICGTIDEARKRLVFALEYMKANDKGKTIPFAAIWDSLSGATTEAVVDKIMGDDDMSARAFPENALYDSKFWQGIGTQIAHWPFTLIGINHQKDKPSEMPGLPNKKGMPGGDSIWFHSSYVFWMERIGTEQRMTRVVDGKAISCPINIHKIKIECGKSSLGTDGRSIPVNFVWYTENGEQVSTFDWDDSTAALLNIMQNQEKTELRKFKGLEKGFEKGGLESIIDVECTSGLYTSDRLGLVRVSGSVLGAAVHADEGLMEQLIDFFHFHRYPIFASVPDTIKVPKVRAPKAPMPESTDIPV